MQQFAKHIKDKGMPLDHVIGFLDAKVLFTCRPTDGQEVAYSGHKHAHGVKFQTVVSPDGISRLVYGPRAGCENDVGILNKSNLIQQLQNHMMRSEIKYYLYSDLGYVQNSVLFHPSKGDKLTQEQHDFNGLASSCRMSVEWDYGHLAADWAYTDYKKKQQIQLTQVGPAYVVAFLLDNCKCCLNQGNQISSYFGCAPPTLEAYLNSHTTQ